MRILEGDCREVLRTLPDESVHCVVTSPPYWGLRDYGVEGQIGLESTPGEYVEKMVAVFREVRRVLRKDGTLWLNLGDSYAANRSYQVPSTKGGPKHSPAQGFDGSAMAVPPGLKPKDLIGIPWLVAFALQADGWWLRSDIVWSKSNPMPESVRDRPTRAHEYLFLLSRSARYHFDADAVRLPAKYPNGPNAPDKIKSPYGQGFTRRSDKQRGHSRRHAGFNDRWDQMERDEQVAAGANIRTVWNIATRSFLGAHFATFPEALVEPCVLAGCPAGGTVLDPFAGSGTVGVVCSKLGRDFIGIELSTEYAAMARRRIAGAPMSLFAVALPSTGEPGEEEA